MAKAQSDTEPPGFVKSRGKTQVNYNAHEIEVEDPDGGIRTAWEYDYVEVEGKVTKVKVLAAIKTEGLEDDPDEWTPDGAATQYSDAKENIDLSGIKDITYAQLDTYINNHVTDMASAKAYLKKLSKVVLAMLKAGYDA